jgi:chemotaxis signal transduction protein
MTRALELRTMFDRGFAVAELASDAACSDFVCLRIGGEPAAIGLGDIASLHADLRVVPLPTPAAELLGVTAIRAQVVPIYDLSVALGGAPTGAARWTVVARGGAAGFGFAGFDGHARIPDAAIAIAAQRGHVRGQFALGGRPHSILDLGSVLAAIGSRWRHRSTSKEH